VIDVAALAQRAVVDRLGAVAVRVEQEGAVVVVAVLGTQPGRPVVAVAGLRARPPEGIDVLARGRDEADVQPPRHRVLLVGLRQGEVVPFGEVLIRGGRFDPDRLEDEAVEAHRGLTVGDADRDVVEHSRKHTKPTCAAGAAGNGFARVRNAERDRRTARCTSAGRGRRGPARPQPPATSAALSDAIPAAVARAGEPLRCEVTPSDGVLRDPAASASATPAA
jgi:hypothetical protein